MIGYTRWLLPLVLVLSAGFGFLPATAVEPARTCGAPGLPPCGDADSGKFVLTGSEETPESSGSAGGPTVDGGKPAGSRPTFTERVYAPTCGQNGPEAGDVMCMMAASICPNPQETAFWVWTREVNRSSGAKTAWQRVYTPPYQCIGPTDPVVTVPVQVLIAGILTRGFVELPLPRGDVQVRPSGQTLMNVDTQFSTATTTQPLPPRVILGKTVTVLARAERYDWHWGDGTVSRDVGPGSAKDPVLHTYRAPGRVGPYVTVTWSGTFTIAGSATVYPIEGAATTDGVPADLAVRRAQSELVSE